MISEQQLPELVCYKKIEKTIPLSEGVNCAHFVSPNTNVELPVHRWFRFKESFAAGLLRVITGRLTSLGRKFRLLDPFCGVGTSLIAAQELSMSGYEIEAIGIEGNPFIAFAARTKVRWPEIDAAALIPTGELLLKQAKKLSPHIPALSSLSTGRCISRYMSERVLAVRQAIQMAGNSPTHDALLLGLASAIEPVSRIRKDGRALRIVDRSYRSLPTILKDKWSRMANDVSSMRGSFPSVRIPQVMLGDGRNLSANGIVPESIDLVLTSPPYPNNIDYYEVYKLELWLLGFIRDLQAYLDLRRTTFQSHPRCNEEPPAAFLHEVTDGKLKDILQPVLKRLRANSEPWRQRLLLGYFGDMWTSLHEQYRCLRENGYAVLIVGNSLHGGSNCPYLIPTDILTSMIGEAIGFKIDQVIVARPSKRRLSGNHFLRESVIILKKTHGC